jgi:DNA-binding IclR family transcriptional regulator
MYRRMLSDMSHRYVTAQQLVTSSGASKIEVRDFLHMLEARGMLRLRDADEPDSRFGPIGGWLRRAFNAAEATR